MQNNVHQSLEIKLTKHAKTLYLLHKTFFHLIQETCVMLRKVLNSLIVTTYLLMSFVMI